MDEKKVRKAIEIFKGIEEVRGNLPEDGNDIEEAFYTAIEALEKQLPRKVISYHNDNINREQYRCPVCENLVLTEDITTSLFGTDKEYCDKCGQRLDWTEC